MKNILLGVTGSIAAYKSPELVRQLRARGFLVKVVLTDSAKEFVTETTLQAVSLNPRTAEAPVPETTVEDPPKPDDCLPVAKTE